MLAVHMHPESTEIQPKARGFTFFARTSILSKSIEAARRFHGSEIFQIHRTELLKAIQTRAGFGEASSSSGGLCHRVIPILR